MSIHLGVIFFGVSASLLFTASDSKQMEAFEIEVTAGGSFDPFQVVCRLFELCAFPSTNKLLHKMPALHTCVVKLCTERKAFLFLPKSSLSMSSASSLSSQ